MRASFPQTLLQLLTIQSTSVAPEKKILTPDVHILAMPRGPLILPRLHWKGLFAPEFIFMSLVTCQALVVSILVQYMRPVRCFVLRRSGGGAHLGKLCQ